MELNTSKKGRKNEHEINPMAKGHSADVYRSSGNLFIVRRCTHGVPRHFIDASRGDIEEFSAGSGIRMHRFLRKCRAQYICMVTLTYPFTYPTNGPRVKEHLRRFIQELGRNSNRNKDLPGFSAFWFLEFQSRGAPHFHILTTFKPSYGWVADEWYKIVGSEDERHRQVGTRIELLRTGRGGTIAYAPKYAAKNEQKVVPDDFKGVGRFWGVSGDKRVVAADTVVDAEKAKMSGVIVTKKILYSLVQSFIDEGRAEILVRKEGTLVVNMLDDYTRLMVRTAVSRLGAVIGLHTSFFDAEVTWERY